LPEPRRGLPPRRELVTNKAEFNPIFYVGKNLFWCLHYQLSRL
jgi:hypothetical protein